MRERSIKEGLLAWKPATDSINPSLVNDFLTVKLANDSFVARNSGQVSLTQLKPMDPICFEIRSTGCLLRPSATTASRWEAQFTQASLTRRPVSSTIHRESVESGSAAAGERRSAREKEDRKKRERSLPMFWIFLCFGCTKEILKLSFYMWEVGVIIVMDMFDYIYSFRPNLNIFFYIFLILKYIYFYILFFIFLH